MRFIIASASLLALWPYAGVLGQKPKLPLKEPKRWDEVRFNHQQRKFCESNGELMNEDYWLFTNPGNQRTKANWRVWADRTGLHLRDKPEGSPTGMAVEMGEKFFVFDEKGEWLHVGRAMDEPPQGWFSKKHLVLWENPLKEQRTRIELKALLVNRLNEINTVDQLKDLADDKKQLYEAFDGPGAEAKLIKEDYLYDVLYIYKFEKDPISGGRWLVSGCPELADRNVCPMVGWVSTKKVQVWDTRLCLEPNDSEAAVAERRARGIRAQLYPSERYEAQQAYLNTGQGKGLVDGEERDPAFRADLSRGTRMDGLLFRYPVLDAKRTPGSPDNCSFRTGVSGRMNLGSSGLLENFKDDDYLRAQRTYTALEEQKDVLTTVFVVEASSGMQEDIAAVKSTVRAIHQKHHDTHTLQFGIVCYRNELSKLDAVKNPESDYLEVLPLTTNMDQVQTWIDGRTARDAGDPGGEGRAVYFALKRGLEMLKPYQTNVLVHICRRPDNTVFNPMFTKGKTKVDPSTLGDDLDMGRAAHYLGYVTIGARDLLKADLRRDAYDAMKTDVMQPMSNAIGIKMKGIAEFGKDKSGTGKAKAAKPESTILVNKTEETRMTQGHFVMKAKLLASPDKNLASTIMNDFGACLDQSERTRKAVENVVEDESMLKQRASDITYYAAEMTKFNVADSLAILQHLAANKVHVFIDAATYFKVSGLTQPLFNYVLFMEDDVLDQAIKDLGRVLQAFDKGEKTETCASLKQIYKGYAEAALGSKFDESTTLNEIQERMMGINEIDMIKTFEQQSVLKGLKLEDLMDEKRCRPEAFSAYEKSAKENHGLLNNIKTSGNYYQVPGDDERKYYWVPIEYLFD